MAIENEADERHAQNAQQNMFDGSNGANLEETAQPMSDDPSEVTGPRSLERLKDRVELAIKELQRLRSENASMKKQIDSIQSQGPAAGDGTAVVFNESPEALKAQIKQYIEAIDRLTAQSNGADSPE